MLYRAFFLSVTSKNKVSYTDHLSVSVTEGCGTIVLDDYDDVDDDIIMMIIIIIIPKFNGEHPLIY